MEFHQIMVFVRTDKLNKTNQLHGDNFVTVQLFLLKTDPMNGSCITHLIFIINNMSCVAQSNITVKYKFVDNIISTKF